jgi:hypothetical protein
LACVGNERVGPLPTDSSDGGHPTDGGTAALNDAGDAGGLPASKLVFVSSAKQNSSELRELGRDCTSDLSRHGRSTGFAWAQDSAGKSPTFRLGAYDGPWVLPSGKIVFAKKADITGGAGAAVAINETIDGVHVTDGPVFTALDKTGAVQVGKNCGGWSSSASDTTGTSIGTVGTSWADDGTTMSCHDQAYLICFED